LCDVLLELADDGLFLPLWSETILAETKNALVGKRGMPEAKAERRIEQMRFAQPEAAVTGFEAFIADMGNHPKDRHVLAAAIHGACPVIVTANLVDFPAHAPMPRGVTAIRPDAFLLRLVDEDEDGVWAAIERKRASYRRPPRAMAEFCEVLAATVPRFAAWLSQIDAAKRASAELNSSETSRDKAAH
jgi:hypothetical protein